MMTLTYFGAIVRGGKTLAGSGQRFGPFSGLLACGLVRKYMEVGLL